MDYYCLMMSEIEGKNLHDNIIIKPDATNRVWVPDPVIIGAGPSGLATAACLKQKGIRSIVLERANCIASLWQNKTYDRLKLHLPKKFCELPLLPFPNNFPTYPTKRQFLGYLEMYANHFGINPVFNQTVVSAEFDRSLRAWRVKTRDSKQEVEHEYVTKRLIVATGENADEVVPKLEGMDDFEGTVLHTSEYKNGGSFCGKKVLVVGCGNSGMEVSLDLCNHNASTSLVVRDRVHVLPQEMLGVSTFGLSMWLLKWFPVWVADQILLLMCYIFLSDTAKYGLVRPKIGPLQLKNVCGKTPVIDVGTIDKIRTGAIKVVNNRVCNGIKRLRRGAVEFVDGKVESFDAVILATGFKSNVPSWLKEGDMFSDEGIPKKAFPNGWKGEHGLYAVGFTKRGLLGASADAKKIAQDIEDQCNAQGRVEMNHYI